MTPRRHRTFLDHKPPLVAFVLIAVASLGLLVHVARSDAAPAWMRDGATVVVSGGSPLTRQVLDRTVLDRDPAPVVTDAPAVAAPPAPVASASRPPAAPTREPARPPQHAAPPQHDGRTTPDLQPGSPTPSAEPSPAPAYPGKGPNVPAHQAPGLPEGHAQGDDEGDDAGNVGGGDGGRPDPGPIRGSQPEHAHGHPWYDEDWQDADDSGRGPGRGHGHGHGHGHGNGHDDRGHGPRGGHGHH